MTKRQEHEAELRFRLIDLINAVTTEKAATYRRDLAQDAYDKALSALLSDVPA